MSVYIMYSMINISSHVPTSKNFQINKKYVLKTSSLYTTLYFSNLYYLLRSKRIDYSAQAHSPSRRARCYGKNRERNNRRCQVIKFSGAHCFAEAKVFFVYNCLCILIWDTLAHIHVLLFSTSRLKYQLKYIFPYNGRYN